jgi:hypothetical protein
MGCVSVAVPSLDLATCRLARLSSAFREAVPGAYRPSVRRRLDRQLRTAMSRVRAAEVAALNERPRRQRRALRATGRALARFGSVLRSARRNSAIERKLAESLAQRLDAAAAAVVQVRALVRGG